MSNYIRLFDVDVIAYPCLSSEAGLVTLLVNVSVALGTRQVSSAIF